jgi:transposase-like protein
MEAAVPRTLQEAVTYFSDKKVAHDFFAAIRWPNGVACPRKGCGSADVTTIRNRAEWRCRECGRQFSAKVGTIFESSPIGLDKWLPALWLLTANRNGVSSHELARALGVTQKTGWFMLHRLRLALKDDNPAILEGEVEVDETYVGGVQKTTWLSRAGFKKAQHGPGEGKATVLGMASRNTPEGKSRVRAMVVKDRSAASLIPPIRANVLPTSILYTDAWGPYRRAETHYAHEIVDHTVEYVRGRVHTNTIENFWNCLKRTLHGTYIAPRPFHLDAYLDEQCFRFNVRDQRDGARFVAGLKGAEGRRLTYAALTTSHPRWRLRPGRVARGIARRVAMQSPPIPGESDRL